MPIDPTQVPALWFLGALGCFYMFLKRARAKRLSAWGYFGLGFIASGMAAVFAFSGPRITEVALRPAVEATVQIQPRALPCNSPPVCMHEPCKYCKDI